MEVESMNIDFTEIFDSWPKITYDISSPGKASPDSSFSTEYADKYAFLVSILKDDKSEFVSHAKRHLFGEDAESVRSEALKLLSACCAYDSINCASSIINGDVGSVPYINDVASGTGHSPLHTAAEAHAPRCVEMLLKRRARTDVRTKDERGLLPLELSLCNGSLDVSWNPSSDSIGDLILLLGDKDLTVVKLLVEKTKEVVNVANAYARAGAIVPFTVLLIIASDKIREATVALRDGDYSKSNPKTTIYEAVIQEALRANSSMQSECREKRILLLREIELLQLFDAAVFTDLVDKQTPPLISVVLAGDEAVLGMLINTSIDVYETDAEGNTVLQCSLKGSSVPHVQQTRIMRLLIAYGARVSHRNKLGLSAVHFAAANGNLSALEIILEANPELVHAKTVIKETPLFFAVKNNHLDCVDLLLQCGASTEIHNLRKQRPIDLTQSQDIRFLLNPTNISCFSKETEIAQLHQSAILTKEADEETGSFLGNSLPPPWLKKFINWFPKHLRDTSESWRETGYPLSSLKADFRIVFGMDLNHSSLGFYKLSDFVRSFPKLCKMKIVPLGKSGPATHLVLLPSKSTSQIKGRHPEPLIIKNEPEASSSPDLGFIQQAHDSKALKKTEPESQPRLADVICREGFVQQVHISKTLKPEPKQEPHQPLLTTYYRNHHQLKHPVLETLARVRNSTSIFFLREFDFHQSYETCLREGMCFLCKNRMLLWANFPCGHRLWCSSCKQQVTQSASSNSIDHHRCVVCDAKVEYFILSPPFGFRSQWTP